MGDTVCDHTVKEHFADAQQRWVKAVSARLIYFLAFDSHAILKLFFSIKMKIFGNFSILIIFIGSENQLKEQIKIFIHVLLQICVLSIKHI